MTWHGRLPEGVELRDHKPGKGFSLSVSIPGGEDGLHPLVCPDHPEHRFKAAVTSDKNGAGQAWCPYCGRHAAASEFMSAQRVVLDAAARAAAEQYVRDRLNKMMSDAFRGNKHVTFTPGRPAPRRSLPKVEIEPTRRVMTCNRCGAVAAVYGLAVYCCECGQLAPAQHLGEVLRVHRDRMEALDLLPADTRLLLDESGVTTVTYESTIKDGFGTLETYLKARFTEDAPAVAATLQSTVFQRLKQARDLYADHLGVDLVAAVGQGTWDALLQAASLRHVLTHNSGMIDAKFLKQNTEWPQAEGQRVHVSRAAAFGYLDALDAFTAGILAPAPDQP